MQGRDKLSGLLTECHAQDPIVSRVLCPRDHSLELSMVYGQPAYQVLRRPHTHSPKAICIPIVICRWLGHVQRMDRICNAPNFERHIDLGITIYDPRIPIELRDINQLGPLGARVDCIHHIPVAQRTLGVSKIGRRITTHSGNCGKENPVSRDTCN